MRDFARVIFYPRIDNCTKNNHKQVENIIFSNNIMFV